MDVAALIFWLLTAAGGFVLLGTWIAKGGHQPGDGSPSRFPPGLVFGHFLLAATGLVLWIIYLAADSDGLTWVAFAVVAVAALLGFGLLSRWLPQVRGRTGPTGDTTATAEAQFPVPVVVLHGLLAATTLVLVLIAALSG
jgi:manganese efflux pump family protein